MRVPTIHLLFLPLAACAAAPDGGGGRGMERLTAQHNRLLSRYELSGNCPGLTIRIKSRIDRLRELEKKVNQEQQTPSPTLMGAFEQPPTRADLTQERERVAELNEALEGKGCKTVDVDEELRRVPAAPTATTNESR